MLVPRAGFCAHNFFIKRKKIQIVLGKQLEISKVF